ncbi:cytochrome P450 [Flagelloscypha sp. PMI_526]|nr:cytochrome P450 [Flagelloscypha sp. PMI_526]
MVQALLVSATVLVVASTLWRLLVKTKNRSRPPGPPGNILFGHALMIPPDRQWITWNEWAKTYGDVMRLKVFGSELLVLSSLHAAQDLLEHRGNIYSDRPIAIMAGELHVSSSVGWARGLGYSNGPPNHRFREFRRVFHQFMGPRACSAQSMIQAQEEQNLRLLNKLLQDPLHFYDHCRTFTSSSILALTYGYSPKDDQDPLSLIKIAEDAMAGFAVASEPGRWWVDSLPALKYIPSWFPGTSFLDAAMRMRRDLERLYNVPYDFVKRSMVSGTCLESFTSTNIEAFGNLTPENEEFIKAAGASLYSGGAETTPSALTSFILAMCLNPDVLATAQAEVDGYMKGLEEPRLPGIQDQPFLPYIDAIVNEIWRWNPSVPLGLPHLLTQDDSYRGYHIPAGTTVWANIWAILHDPALFGPSPEFFDPSRFLDPDHPERKDRVLSTAFGFGRRICPGVYLAQNAVFIAIVTMIYMFDIECVEGGSKPEVEYDGFISHPRPFGCKIRPRSADLIKLLKTKMEYTS